MQPGCGAPCIFSAIQTSTSQGSPAADSPFILALADRVKVRAESSVIDMSNRDFIFYLRELSGILKISLRHCRSSTRNNCVAVNSVRLGLAGGASAVPKNIEDSTRWRGASADKSHSHIELQSAAFHAA